MVEIGKVESQKSIKALLLTTLVVQALFASQLSYVGVVGLTRVSTAFFVGHLTRHPPQVWTSHILAAGSGVWTVVAILVIALRPNLARPWATLDGTESLVNHFGRLGSSTNLHTSVPPMDCG